MKLDVYCNFSSKIILKWNMPRVYSVVMNECFCIGMAPLNIWLDEILRMLLNDGDKEVPASDVSGASEVVVVVSVKTKQHLKVSMQ